LIATPDPTVATVDGKLMVCNMLNPTPKIPRLSTHTLPELDLATLRPDTLVLKTSTMSELEVLHLLWLLLLRDQPQLPSKLIDPFSKDTLVVS